MTNSTTASKKRGRYSLTERLYRWWVKHLLFSSRVPYPLWRDCLNQLPVLARLTAREQHQLRKLTGLFLHEKTFIGARGLEVDQHIAISIGAQACLLILHLDLDYFRGWSEILVYPDPFVVPHIEHEDSGVVHETHRTLAGESWQRGPVILSWADARPGAHPHDAASNVVLHEFAHKLDMFNGVANGMPPLHPSMDRKAWTKAMSQTYKRLYHDIERHHHTAIDPYAAESPAEFFAVLTEVFFMQPKRLQHLYPEVYHQFSLFYRQDPLNQQKQI